LKIRDVWLSGQLGLRKAVRWKKYRNKNEAVREQDSLQHSYSLVVIGMICLTKLRRYVVLDAELLLKALTIHDHGEGELGIDTHYIDKTDDGDLNEYLAFERRFQQLDSEIYSSFEDAFLLQYAGRDREIFPADARSVMARLRVRYPREILAFEAIESWDYLLFAIEQYEELGFTMMMVQVLRNQVDRLDRYARDLPGFGQEIWTSEIQAWARDLLRRYEGQWIEQKGEK
jgi:hypothetical protein